MINIPEKNLVYFDFRIPFNSASCDLNMPLSDNAYLLFRKHKQPNEPKPIILVNKTDDAIGTRLDDILVTYIEINKAGFITTNTINSNVVQGYFLYPYDENGEIELYDIYVVAKKNVNGFSQQQLDNYIPTQGTNNYLYALFAMPTDEYLTNNNNTQDDNRISNLVKDGQFSITYLDLPADNGINQGLIRNPVTRINDNITYEVSSNQNYNSSLFGDILSIGTFVGDSGLEASPKNYLRIQAINNNTLQPWIYRDIAFYFEPYFKFNDRPFTLSFCAINNNLDLTVNLPISIGYERFYGNGALVEPRSTFTAIPAKQITNIWTKYTTTITLEPNTNYVQNGNDTYIKILLRLPVNLNSYDLSITNIYLDYGSLEVYYPIDYEQTYNNTVTNYGTSIVNTSSGYIPLSSRAGEIKQYIHSNDTETSILADGRIIYPDDVHYYNMIDPASGKNATFNIPYSNSYQTGLYDLIGYKYGTGNDHFTCDSLHNLTWEADATESTFDNIFYWNYVKFKPTFITSFGDNSKIAAIELHRGQDVDTSLRIESFFEQNNNSKIWYGADSTNYLDTAKTNATTPLDDYYYGNNAANVTYAAVTLGLEKRFSSFIRSDSFGDLRKNKILFPIEDYAQNLNNANPAQQLNRTFLYGDTYGSIDLNLIGSKESFDYSIPVNYYTSISETYIPTNVDALTLIVTKNKDTFYLPAQTKTAGVVFSNQGIGANNVPIVRIMENSGVFPTVNPDYTISAVPADGITNVNPYLINTQYVNTYYQDPAYAWNQAKGTATSLKKIKLFLATQNKAGFGIRFQSLIAANYYGLWFYAESEAKRILKEITYVNNIPTVNNIEINDNKFCFYFSNGSTPEPVSGLIPSGTKFIPVIITGTATNKSTFANILEKAVNSYRVQIPNLQGVVLKSYGISMFENSETTKNTPVLANNFRNDGSGFPKLNIYSDRYGSLPVQTTLGNTLQNTLSLDIVYPENYMYVYNHISVC